ncbi:MAG: triose-phosphate isomerase [Acidobacteria bacterium 21-70-11]|nr:MAG: triose-phosphate isomerase [Acidobacteria bacterium 21-70-11]HQT93945.1 triose-phosphate isomerase [Thermoanaerobaculaceae bacterium]
MSRRPLIAANWKMHGTVASVQAYLEALVDRVGAAGPEVVVCPPFTLLPAAVLIATGSEVAIGAQNCHWEDSGAFTGEVAPAMLAELGVRWVIAGHSERRQYFGESDASAGARAKAAQRAGLDVIFCVGETLEQREAGATLAVLERQSTAIEGLDPAHLALAYEPIWAIGTGKTATATQAQEAHAALRRRAGELLGEPAAAGLRILYGGSVKPDNAAVLLAEKDVDGALVGGASLDVEGFWAIIHAAPGEHRGAEE